MMSEIARVLTALTQLFDDLGIEYRVGGAVASSALGIPRSTLDIDIDADEKESQVPLLVRALEDEFYIDAELIHHALSRQRSFNIIHLETMTKVDIFPPKSSAWDQRSFERYVVKPIGGEGPGPQPEFKLCTAEDVILHKLRWFDLGGRSSSRQMDAVTVIIRVQQRTLDLAYLNASAQEIGVTELLAECMRRASQAPIRHVHQPRRAPGSAERPSVPVPGRCCYGFRWSRTRRPTRPSPVHVAPHRSTVGPAVGPSSVAPAIGVVVRHGRPFRVLQQLERRLEYRHCYPQCSPLGGGIGVNTVAVHDAATEPTFQ